jgi:hypothetical protein
VVLKEPLLLLGKRASHEGDNARQTRLMDSEAIEEAFQNHCALAVKRSPVQIEEDQQFTGTGAGNDILVRLTQTIYPHKRRGSHLHYEWVSQFALACTRVLERNQSRSARLFRD